MVDAPSNATELMSEEDIAKALEAARTLVARAEQERSALDRTIAAAREEQRLLERLLALRQGLPVGAQPVPIAGGEGTPTIADTERPAVQAVIEELTAAGRPVHISELMRLLRARQVPIPGSGTQANLITHLRRDARFVRPSRGMYGLAAWGLESMMAPRRRRRRKHLRVTASKGRAGE
jgi:hypothetical protein